MPVLKEFFSHPKYERQYDPHLNVHLTKVADSVKDLLRSVNIDEKRKRAAYYAGLLHDIGKLKRSYQELFNVDNKEQLKRNNSGKREHAISSAWIAYNFLKDKKGEGKELDKISYNQAIAIIFGHHTRLTKPKGPDRSIDEELPYLCNNLKAFIERFGQEDHFRGVLDINKLDNIFNDKISFQINSFNSNVPLQINYSDFFDINIMYSALLQADRGYFNGRKDHANFVDEKGETSIKLDTSKLQKEGPLSYLRTAFQDYIYTEFDPDKRLVIIDAPTGIGKTKAFLDLIKRYKNKKRIIYFSPLLALGDDFESKIYSIVDKNDKENILEYNSIFSGTLKIKGEQRDDDNTEIIDYSPEKWDFDVESLNYPFIVTTTQRLLMTLFSNLQRDKMKLLSFHNSILVIDEIQTLRFDILKVLLTSLITLSEKLDFKVIILSATIPSIISDAEREHKDKIQIIKLKEEILKDYMNRTKKEIDYKDLSDESSNYNIENLVSIAQLTGKVMFMFNTKRKAMYCERSLKQNNQKFLYITSGIRKCDREDTIKKIKSANDRCVVISTQTLEAGVDISFDRIYRELAPLDSIVQVLGRLNREANLAERPILTVFKLSDDSKPYPPLYLKESEEILKAVRNSEELYRRLSDYYRALEKKDNYNENRYKELDEAIKSVELDDVWEKINSLMMDEDSDTIFVPKDEEDYKKIRKEFLEGDSRIASRKYADRQANLPGSIRKLDFERHLDEELKTERGIFVLKDLNQYDREVGLDIHLDKVQTNQTKERII
ncbi:MAG: CRISPR-associated helicase Cas3' [Candidatus Micrarchaeaceae archaeon]